MKEEAYSVRAVRCSHLAGDEEIYERLVAATAPLQRAWAKLEAAGRIVIKPNMARPPDKIKTVGGRRQELVDPSVFRALLRLLRERTRARLVVVDTLFKPPVWDDPAAALNYRGILEEFGVDYVNADAPPFTVYEVPGGGQMFARYLLSACIGEADAFVSIAGLKTHLFQGVTLSLKNLFGLMPMEPHGKDRRYYHHLIRLSYVLGDLGRVAAPCLNVIDGLAGQSGREWNGEGRIADRLIAGDHPIATDACATWLMGLDPRDDWPRMPFLRDRSALRIAAENGFGTVDLDEIDFHSEVEPMVGQFTTFELDPPEMVRRWRLTSCEQGLFYRDNREKLLRRYAGEYVLLQDNEVIWHGQSAASLPSRRDLAGSRKDSAIWTKYVDPEEAEGENFTVYERELANLNSWPPAGAG